jgi:glycosyltransferase involved in cell wall biosynthesis
VTLQTAGLTSVIIPTYNHGKYVARAVDSVLKQTYPSYEILVVDDGSTDNTRKILAPYAGEIEYIYQENRGLSSARNTGLTRSNGQYVQFLDADDSIFPNKLEAQVTVLEQNRSIDVVAHGYQLIDESGEILARISYPKREVGFDDLLLENLFSPESFLFRARCFDVAGLFDENLKSCEDWDMWLRITADVGCILCHNEQLSKHSVRANSMRQHADNMCKSRLTVLEKTLGLPPAKEMPRNLKQRAYFNAYLKCAWGYYTSGRTEPARESLASAVRSYPTALKDHMTYYEFIKLFEPYGHSDTVDVRKYEKVKDELYAVLDGVFLRQGPICAAMPAREIAYSTAYFGLALRYYKFGDFAKFLEYYKEALKFAPKWVVALSGKAIRAFILDRLNRMLVKIRRNVHGSHVIA